MIVTAFPASFSKKYDPITLDQKAHQTVVSELLDICQKIEWQNCHNIQNCPYQKTKSLLKSPLYQRILSISVFSIVKRSSNLIWKLWNLQQCILQIQLDPKYRIFKKKTFFSWKSKIFEYNKSFKCINWGAGCNKGLSARISSNVTKPLIAPGPSILKNLSNNKKNDQRTKYRYLKSTLNERWKWRACDTSEK